MTKKKVESPQPERCPCCGGKVALSIVKSDSTPRYEMYHTENPVTCPLRFSVDSPSMTEKDFVELWNRRTEVVEPIAENPGYGLRVQIVILDQTDGKQQYFQKNIMCNVERPWELGSYLMHKAWRYCDKHFYKKKG